MSMEPEDFLGWLESKRSEITLDQLIREFKRDWSL